MIDLLELWGKSGEVLAILYHEPALDLLAGLNIRAMSNGGI